MFGEIPDGLVVRHKCDNRLCINPEHLELGTVRDNVLDMVKRGRHKSQRGSNNNLAKLNEDDVSKIKALLKRIKRIVYIASMFNVSSSTICDIRAGRTWGHLK